MEVLTGTEMPLWLTIITWVITVGIGVVGYKYIDRWLTHKKDTRQDIIGEYVNMRARIDKLEQDKDDTNKRLFELMKELSDYKIVNAVQQEEIKRLTQTITLLQAQMSGDLKCPFMEEKADIQEEDSDA